MQLVPASCDLWCQPAPEAPLMQLCHGWCLVQSHVSHVTCVCLLLLFCSHYQIVVVSYSPGVSFDRSRPPNEVFGEDRFVPYEMVSHMCGSEGKEVEC